MSCAICQLRKEKRFCLAVHGRICPQCCGEQREVTLDCPSECPYLQQAREHEKPRSIDAIPAEEIFPKIEIPQHFLHDHEPLVVGITHMIAQVWQGDRSLNDREVIGSLVNLVKSYRTLVGSGLLYEEPTTNLAQQALAQQLRESFTEYRELEARHLGYSKLKDTDIMLALVFVLRLAHSYTSGRPRSRAFLDIVHAQFPDAQPASAVGQQTRGRLVIP
jgi:hypothetical protein